MRAWFVSWWWQQVDPSCVHTLTLLIWKAWTCLNLKPARINQSGEEVNNIFVSVPQCVVAFNSTHMSFYFDNKYDPRCSRMLSLSLVRWSPKCAQTPSPSSNFLIILTKMNCLLPWYASTHASLTWSTNSVESTLKEASQVWRSISLLQCSEPNTFLSFPSSLVCL